MGSLVPGFPLLFSCDRSANLSAHRTSATFTALMEGFAGLNAYSGCAIESPLCRKSTNQIAQVAVKVVVDL